VVQAATAVKTAAAATVVTVAPQVIATIICIFLQSVQEDVMAKVTVIVISGIVVAKILIAAGAREVMILFYRNSEMEE